MKIIRNIILFIKKILNKEQEVKLLETPKQIISKNKKEDFIQNLKITSEVKKKKIETLICEGNGLGIQKKIRS